MPRKQITLLTLVAILALGLRAHATAPTAAITGPERVLSGEPIILSFQGTNGDAIWFKYYGPALDSTPTYIKKTLANGQQVVSGARAVASTPGIYTFTIIATGRANNASRLDANAAFWNVTVTERGPPTPQPIPPPNPEPIPPDPNPIPPNPDKAPVPLAIHLNAIAQYGGNNVSPDDLKFAAVRDDPNLVANLKALNCDWRAWEENTLTTKGENIFDALNLTSYFTRYGRLPAIVIYDNAGNAYDANGNKTLSAIAPPLTADGMVNLVKKLRGQK